MGRAKKSSKASAKAAPKKRRAKKRPAKDGTRRGRKPLLTGKVIDDLEAALELGASMRDAAGHAGIGYNTMFTYLEKADDEKADPIYRELRDRLEKARACGNVKRLEQLRDAAKDPRNWKAAAHLLAVRDPENYSEKRRVELTGAGGGPIQFYLPAEETDDE